MATRKQRDFFEREVFEQGILAAVGENAGTLPPAAKLDSFLSIRGAAYAGDLMVVGRATNGWWNDALPSDLAQSEQRMAYAEKVFKSVTANGGKCPLSFVTDYWHKPTEDSGYRFVRSPFWRVIRTLTSSLDIQGVNVDDPKCLWPSHIVWSNLYKMAPSRPRRGNPSERLCDIQEQGCKELLRLEVSIYRPNKLVFLTGDNWAAPFLKALDARDDGVRTSGQVSRVGTIRLGDGHETRFVVASHPQGKPQAQWTDDVLKAFRDYR